jgi:hypothetical protein
VIDARDNNMTVDGFDRPVSSDPYAFLATVTKV